MKIKKQRFTKLLAVLLTIGLLLSFSVFAAEPAPPSGGGGGPMPVAASQYFKDVTGDGVDAVDFLFDKGFVTGTTQPSRGKLGSYSPAASIKRGDFVLMLTRAFDIKGKGGESFSDVDSDAYFADAIGKAASAGLIKGDGDGTFRPYDTISREEAYTILYRAAKSGISKCVLCPAEDWIYGIFTDGSKLSSWSKEAVYALAANKVISGGKLSPKADCTRLDMAKALAALVQTDNSNKLAPKDYDEVFVVVHTNDVHGVIQNEARVKGVADYYKEKYGDSNVITVSAGDIYAGGAAVAHYYLGELIPPIMTAAGYDIAVPGNNDFNLEKDHPGQMEKLGRMAGVNTIAANLYYADDQGNSTGERVFAPYEIFTTGKGASVGVFGLAMGGGGSEGVYVTRDDLITSEDMVTELGELGCTAIIGVGHKGWNDIPDFTETTGALKQTIRRFVEESDPVDETAEEESDSPPPGGGMTSAVLAELVEDMDALVDGHSHSVIEDGDGWISPNTGCIVTQAGEKGNYIGVLKLYLKNGQVVKSVADLMDAEEMALFPADPEAQALVDAAYARFDKDTSMPVGETPYLLNGARLSGNNNERGIRSNEQNLGDLICDALRWKMGTEIAFAGGTRIRASIKAGPISLGDWFGVFANGADYSTVEMSGQEVLDILASIVGALPGETPDFKQVSGVSFSYVYDDDTVTIFDVLVNGEPIDKERIYMVSNEIGGPDADESIIPEISGMEAMAQIMAEYMVTDECVIFPDVVRPDNRINPADSVPGGAVSYVYNKADIKKK